MANSSLHGSFIVGSQSSVFHLAPVMVKDKNASNALRIFLKEACYYFGKVNIERVLSHKDLQENAKNL